MWEVHGTSLQMAEGDYGLQLPVTINGTTLTEHDSIVLVFKDVKNGTEILTKEYTNLTDNTANLSLTEAESALFPVGVYCYRLDWYQEGAFMCNIIPDAVFKVVDKA